MTSSPDEQFVLEEQMRFSRSLMWSLQRRFYEVHGSEAWSTEAVDGSETTP